MKKINTLLQKCIIVLALFGGFSAQAQVSTKGTEFWFAYGKIYNHTNANDIIMQIRIVADEAATGTIKFMETGGTIPVNVAAGGIQTVTLAGSQKTASYITSFRYVEKKSIFIQTDVPVSVYALSEVNPALGEALADATNILPVTALGTEYYHLGRVSTQTNNNKNDQYIVIATENGTDFYDNGTKLNSSPLNAGQTYLMMAGPNEDMSGRHITSNKPIAYFSAHNFCNIDGGGDNFFQQLAPVNIWGRNFIVPVTNRELELVRIVASQNNTTITQTGGTIMPGGKNALTLNAGEWVELKITLSGNGCFIQADKPVQVCTYMVGGAYPESVSTNGGDESICWVPAIEQSMDSVVIAPFALSNMTYHSALIVTPTSTKNNTTVSIGGGAPAQLSGGTWYDNPESGMSFYNIELTNTSTACLFVNKAGIIAYGYGFGHAISYYYMAGSAMRNLDLSFYVNDVHNQDLPHVVFNKFETHFRADINGEMSPDPGHLKWYIDGVLITGATDAITWTKTLPNGTYQIKMEVLLPDNHTVKTVESTLIIDVPEVVAVVEVCANTPITLAAQENNGDFPLTYQWQINGINIAGATDSTYTYIPQDGDTIICLLIYDSPCIGLDTVKSNKIIISLNNCGVTVRGTVFPFPYFNIPEIDQMFSVEAKLYDVALLPQGPAAILAAQPIHIDTAIYYDGSEFVPETPKFPGYVGCIDNPGLPINWAAMGYNVGTVNNTYLVENEKPVTSIGLYKFHHVEEGEYILVLSRAGYVTRFAKVYIGKTDQLLGHRELIAGDVNGDLMIDMSDMSYMIGKFVPYGDEIYNAKYDFNSDLMVDMTDMSLMYFDLNFNCMLYFETAECFSAFRSIIDFFMKSININK